MLIHTENKFLPHTADQMFDLVQGVELYPQFLPWCNGTRVQNRQTDGAGVITMTADMIVGFKAINEKYTCQVTCTPLADNGHGRIDITYISGPFKHLYNHWIFTPTDGGCMVDFRVEFEFKSRIMSTTLSLFFSDMSKRMVGAFEERAMGLYSLN